MAEYWEPLTDCKQAKVGMSVRRAHHPDKQPYNDLTIEKLTDGHIGFDDGVIISCNALPHDHYWYRRNWPEA
jgi:hypothetical protein